MLRSLIQEKTGYAVFSARSEFILEVYMESLVLPGAPGSLSDN